MIKVKVRGREATSKLPRLILKTCPLKVQNYHRVLKFKKKRKKLLILER